MHKILGGVLTALALASATLTGAAIVNVGAANAADVGISFNTGDVAFGYNDGYWDKSHTWHKWAKSSYRETYRKSEGNQYHDWKHTRDNDKGWHEGAEHK